MKGIPLTPSARTAKRRMVKCLGWHTGEVWFRGSTYHRFCPACTSRRGREPSLPRAATPLRSALYENI